MPKRSTSYFGVNKATISMSHPLQAPELKCKTHGDFIRDQVTVFIYSLPPSKRTNPAARIIPR